MSKQYQPSTGGPTSPSQSGGRTGGVTNMDFKEEVIQGNVKVPDDVIRGGGTEMNRMAFPIRDAAELQDAQSGGHTGKAVVKLIEWLVRRVAEYLKRQVHKYPFDVMYHNHDINIPIPLTPFITDMNIQETLEAPYISATFDLKIPFEHIQTMFRSAGGRLDAGGYISVNQKAYPSLTNPIDDSRLRDNHFLTQLLVINNIGYNVNALANGQIDCTLSLNCTSFLHSLILGQYKVQETKRKNYNYTDPEIADQKTISGGVEVQKPDQLEGLWRALGVADDEPIRKTTSRVVKTAVKSADGNELINQFWFEGTLYNRFLNLVLEGSITRKDSGADLKDMLTFLGYPKTPASLTFNLGLDKWYELAQRELDKGAVFYVRLLRTQGVPEDQIKTLGKNLLKAFDRVVDNQLPLLGNQGVFKSRNRRVEADTISSPGSATSPTTFLVDEDIGDTTVAAELLKQELARGAGGKLDFEGFEGEEFRLGDVIRVFTVNTPDVLPNNSPDVFPWAQGLGKTKTIIENLNKIGGLYAKGQTIWGACVSTFQPDSKTHELFPVVIPLMDNEWFAKASRFERSIGGILGVIYRKKPIHPYVALNQKSINEEYEMYRRVVSTKTDEQYYKDIKYKLNAEQLGVQQEANVSLDKTFNLDNKEEFAVAKTPLPIVRLKDVISMSFSHNDTMRVNGVRVEHPYSTVDPSASGGLLTEPYINALDASRFGFRYYEASYPFISANTQEKGKYNLGNVQAENLYMTIGDGSKYSTGNILMPLETTYALKQGCWFMINFNDTDYDQETGPRYFEEDRMSKLIAYCTAVSYSYGVDNQTGNIITRTNINFERGSWGGLIPELPENQQIVYTDGKVAPKTRIADGAELAQVEETEQVRYLFDEYGAYGNEEIQAQRNEVFEKVYAGAASVIDDTLRAAEGAEEGSFYYDIDGDGKYEWYKTPDGNAIFINPKDRPKITDLLNEDNDYIFEDFTEIVKDGYTTPVKVDSGVEAPEPVAEEQDDYNFDDEDFEEDEEQ